MKVAFAIALGIISWKDITKCHQMPWPPRFIGAGLTFGMLSLLYDFSEEFANVLAMGFLVALVVSGVKNPNCNHGNCGTPCPGADFLTLGTLTPNAVATAQTSGSTGTITQ